jgi:hypothetical protein
MSARPGTSSGARLGAALRRWLAAYRGWAAARPPARPPAVEPPGSGWAPGRPPPGSAWEAVAEARLALMEEQLAAIEKQMAGQNRLLLLTLVSIGADVVLGLTR